MMDILERLQNIFREVFDDENLVIDETTTPEDIEDWDSLTSMELVAGIEKEFGFKFTTAEIKQLVNVGEIIKVIANK